MHINVHKELSKIDLARPVSEYLDEMPSVLNENWTADEAIAFLRSLGKSIQVRYFYIVDSLNKLVGVISSHNLLFSPADQPLHSTMDRDLLSIHKNVTVRKAIEILKEHRLVALPVTDDEGILIGAIEMQVTPDSYSGDAKNSLQLKKSLYNDIFQLIGVSIDKSRNVGAFGGFAMRMPWLCGNLLAGFACAAIANYFQGVLQKAIILAMFIPLVLTLSESIAMQSMSMSLGFLHDKTIRWKEVFFRVIQEWKTAILLGLTAGLVVEAIAFLLHRDQLPLFVVAVSIFSSMIVTATFGVLTPVIVHSFRMDPKIAAGPLALMFADIMATALYLGLATWWIM